ncbi:MAG TPA: hypothetical protein VEH77_18285 [Roseiarcus sp.]|nr:hypothetical protein [Roseiarcus sp.]
MMLIADGLRLQMDANPDSMFSVAKLVDRIMKEPNWADESDKFRAPEQPGRRITRLGAYRHQLR